MSGIFGFVQMNQAFSVLYFSWTWKKYSKYKEHFILTLCGFDSYKS